MKSLLSVLFLTVLSVNIFAHTGGNVEYTCPLCGTKFESYTQFSGTSFGQNLDLRRYGAIMVPSPIPKCTNCGFVFADKLFTEDETLKLKTALERDSIYAREPNMPNYYYLAREAEIVGRKLDNIIWWFLSAVWENENNEAKNRLINVTIENINKLEKTSEAFNTYQMVKLDLLRRSGQFEAAARLMEEIKTNKEFYKDIIVTMIDFQTELICKKDQGEHPIPRKD